MWYLITNCEEKQNLKGVRVVRSKIRFFKNWICESLGETLLFTRTKFKTFFLSVTTIKTMKQPPPLQKWRALWHAGASVDVWHLASLAHIFWAFSHEISVIRLVDTFLLYKFDWLIVLWRHWLASFKLDFQVSESLFG